MRILITGSSGFLGAAVAQALLARGDSVIAFDAQSAGIAQDRLTEIVGDITDADLLAHTFEQRRPDAVIHCAAIVSVLSSVGKPAQVVRVNIEGSVNVFEAMRTADVKRCIHISSEEAYGVFRAPRVDESHPLDPVMPYGICKAAVEQLGRTYRDLHGLDIVNLRPSWIYGPGLPRARIPKNLIDAALAGRALHLASGAESAIDHTYVDDVVAAILMALDHPRHAFDAYNVGSGTAVSVAQIIDVVRDLVPGAQLSAGPGPYRHGDRIAIVQKGALDVSRAAAEFGWRPRFDIRAGIAAYIDAQRKGQASAHN
jgi:nucleoside-diphosphate-sugar epimerase